MKRWLWKWFWASLMGLGLAATAYLFNRWVGDERTGSIWFEVVAAGAVAFRAGRKWERDKRPSGQRES